MHKKIRCMKHPDLAIMSKYRKGVPLDENGSCEICLSIEGMEIISRVASNVGKESTERFLKRLGIEEKSDV